MGNGRRNDQHKESSVLIMYPNEIKPLTGSHVSEVSRKLADISRIMSDGYHFLKMRGIIEEWQESADQGNQTAVAGMELIDRMYNLCLIVERLSMYNESTQQPREDQNAS